MIWRRRLPIEETPGMWAKRFAFLPVRIGRFWVWLAPYEIRYLGAVPYETTMGPVNSWVYERRRAGVGESRVQRISAMLGTDITDISAP